LPEVLLEWDPPPQEQGPQDHPTEAAVAVVVAGEERQQILVVVVVVVEEEGAVHLTWGVVVDPLTLVVGHVHSPWMEAVRERVPVTVGELLHPNEAVVEAVVEYTVLKSSVVEVEHESLLLVEVQVENLSLDVSLVQVVVVRAG
jgi:hypothetical protein